MKKLIFCALLTALFASFSFAQTDEYNKVEFFGGYSLNRVDFGSDTNNAISNDFGKSRNFNGFNASVTGNVTKYVGLKFDVSGHYKDFDFTVPGVTNRAEVKASLYNILGGVQIKNNSKERKVQPFAHALAGVGIAKAEFNNSFCQGTPGTICPSDLNDSETGFAAVIGGGLDVKVNKRVSIRVAQIDYNPIYSNGDMSNNVRFGFGIVLH